MMKFLIAVYRSVIGACPEVRTHGVHGAESSPRVGPEDLFDRHIVHVNRNSQHGSQGNQVGADMTMRYGAMVGAPVTHHRIHITEGGGSSVVWYKPGGRPGRIGAFV